jgi:hypothetical protein
MAMSEQRIQLTDSLFDIMYKMSAGNPGALNVLCMLYKGAPSIDPDAGLGGFQPILGLDAEGIYASAIWFLFKDICQGNLVKMVAFLRARQLGLRGPLIINDTTVRDVAAAIDCDDLLKRVREQLPNFTRLEMFDVVLSPAAPPQRRR